jgi:hypothetical protein
MRFWLVIFISLFALTEFILWAKNFLQPLPIYLLAGAFLAIASNYEKGIFLGFRRQSSILEQPLEQTATLIEDKDISAIDDSELPSLSENK